MNQNQRTRKGFTLIEMLVVIAVIAVLVSIAIPSVMDYSNKAACAANAANLRAIEEEVTIAYMNRDQSKYQFTLNGRDVEVTPKVALPAAKKTTSPECDASFEIRFQYNINPLEFEVTYGDLTVEDFAAGVDGTYVPAP